jgi:hypothetical protein
MFDSFPEGFCWIIRESVRTDVRTVPDLTSQYVGQYGHVTAWL